MEKMQPFLLPRKETAIEKRLLCPLMGISFYHWSPVVDRIAWYAAELLSSSELKRLKCCANSECGWMFLDYGNGTRRRCSMRECGDRARSKRHYEKKSKNAERNLRPKNIS